MDEVKLKIKWGIVSLTWALLAVAFLGWLGFREWTGSIGRGLQALPIEWCIAFTAFFILISLCFWKKFSVTVRAVTNRRTPFRWLILGTVLLLISTLNANLPLGLGDHPYRWLVAASVSFLIALLVFLAWLLSSIRKKSPDSELGKTRLIADDPEYKHGKLTPTQQQAFDSLEALVRGKEVRSVALTGNWGVGKSKVINELKARLKESRDLIVIDFKPWPHTSEESLVQGFYLAIKEKLSSNLGLLDFDRIMSPVQKLVDKNDKVGAIGVLTDYLRRLFDGSGSPEERIRKILERENKHLLILIDDVERSYDSRILYRSLQLAQHARDMRHVQIITIFEKSAVMRARPKHAIPAESYMEKFFEVEVNVSNSGEDELEDFMKKHDKSPSILPNYISDRLLRSLQTHRGAIRVMNEVLQQIEAWKKIASQYTHVTNFETLINSGDLLAITYIKLKHPRLFADIDTNRSLYTQAIFLKEDFFESTLNDDESQKNKHFESLFKEMEISPEGQDHLRSLLAEVFPEIAKTLGDSTRGVNYAEMRVNKRIGLRSVLDAYFGKTRALETVQRHEAEAEKVLSVLADSSVTDKKLEAAFKDFVNYAREQQSQWNDIVGILFYEISRSDNFKDLRQKAAYAALMAVASSDVAPPKRADLIVVSNVFDLIEELSLRMNQDQKAQLLADVLVPQTLSSRLANPAVAVYVAKMEMSSVAKGLAVNARKSGLKKQLEEIAVQFLSSYFKKHNVDIRSFGEDYLYFWSSWLELAENLGDKSAPLAYINKVLLKDQEPLLDVIVRWSEEEEDYELSTNARLSARRLVQELADLINPDKFIDNQLKKKYDYIKQFKKAN